MSFGSIDQLLIRKEVSSADTQKESTGYRSQGLLFIALAGAYFFFTAAVKFPLYILSLHFR